MKRPKVLLLNILSIGCSSTSKMAAQSHTQGINQQKCDGLFRYPDWFCKYRYLKLEWLKICESCCVNGCHGTNISIIEISRHAFVCHYS